MSLVNSVGTRNIHTFNKYDVDFVDTDRMSEDHLELFASCYHQGSCDYDCDQAKDYFHYDSEETYQRIVEYIKEFDVSCDFDDEDDVMRYFLWLKAGDYHENELEEDEV